MKLYMMIGVPGSGKSTYAKNFIKYARYKEGRDIVYISRDEIRFSLLKEGEPYFSKEKQTYKIFMETMREALKEGKDVLIDATHMTWGSRHKIFRNISNIDGVVVYGMWMRTPYMDCVVRNQGREGIRRVPDDQLFNMIEHFEEPDISEGFEHIQEVW